MVGAAEDRPLAMPPEDGMGGFHGSRYLERADSGDVLDLAGCHGGVERRAARAPRRLAPAPAWRGSDGAGEAPGRQVPFQKCDNDLARVVDSIFGRFDGLK